MSISIFDLFSIGIGPSSSHTVGPMRAAKQFLLSTQEDNLFEQISTINIDLFGSLALTGKGHGTNKAIILGLSGFLPEEIDPNAVTGIINKVYTSKTLNLLQTKAINFTEQDNLLFNYMDVLPHHANGMRFSIYDKNQQLLKQHEYYSVGGGFVLDAAGFAQDQFVQDDQHIVKHPFKSAKQLLNHCQKENKSIADIMLINEMSWHTEDDVITGVKNIWQVMKTCIERGCTQDGILPGGLKVKRRANSLYKKLLKHETDTKDKLDEMNWINLYALAVNEENAAGGRVVTAPTNGAAGIIPAVLNYYMNFTPNANHNGVVTFLLTAAAIGILFKEGASISAAEVGCQGEVGVACSMAAAGLCAALNGTVAQVENAAEMGMEHNLGLTCDPVGGLVQIPCIERNAMGAVQAVNTAKLALMEDGYHHISLDTVIATMRETGKDMQTKYKETSQGGLAVNLPAC